MATTTTPPTTLLQDQENALAPVNTGTGVTATREQETLKLLQ